MAGRGVLCAEVSHAVCCTVCMMIASSEHAPRDAARVQDRELRLALVELVPVAVAQRNTRVRLVGGYLRPARRASSEGESVATAP